MKGKRFNSSPILHIFQKGFFTEPHTFLYHALGKSHDFLISCFRSGQMFLKLWLFEKINFVILFLNKIKPCLIWWISHWYCVSKQETSFICSNMIDQMGFSGDDWLVEVYLSSVLTLVDNVWLVFFFQWHMMSWGHWRTNQYG